MLPPVEADEELMAHGVYQQLRQGKPTRVQEFWTAHSLPDQALIVRSQMLYDGVLPISACYLLRDPELRPVQMVFYWRWQDGRDEAVEYRFADRHMTILYRNQSHEMILPSAYEVYGWHTVTENYLWSGYDHVMRGCQQFMLVAPSIHEGTLWPSLMALEACLKQQEIVPGQTGPHKGFAFSIEMSELGPQRLHIDEFGIPTRWVLPEEELSVVLAEYARIS